jgi:hypothetical protein
LGKQGANSVAHSLAKFASSSPLPFSCNVFPISLPVLEAGKVGIWMFLLLLYNESLLKQKKKIIIKYLHCEILHGIRVIKNLTSLIQKKKMAIPFLSKYPSHLNLANFVSLKLTATNYLLWETHESYHLMKERLLVPMTMTKSLNHT